MSPDKINSNLIPLPKVVEELAESENKEGPTDGKIFTLPNAISILGLAMVIKGSMDIDTIGGLGLIVGGRIMDVLDGFVAKHIKGQSSNLGKIVDASCDKAANFAIGVSLWGSGMAPKPVIAAFLAQNVFNAVVSTTVLFEKNDKVYSTPNTGRYSTALSVVSLGSFAAAELLSRSNIAEPVAVALGATAWAATAGWAVLGTAASKQYYDRLTDDKK